MNEKKEHQNGNNVLDPPYWVPLLLCKFFPPLPLGFIFDFKSVSSRTGSGLLAPPAPVLD